MKKGVKQETNEKKVFVKLTDGSVIKGIVNLNSDTVPMDRISDLLVKGSSTFLVVYGTGVGSRHDKVYVINKQHIIWASPVDEEYAL